MAQPFEPKTSLEYTLVGSLNRAIQDAIEIEKEKIIAEAREQFEQAIRKIVAGTALQVLDYYSMERLGSNLVITVKMEGNDKP